MCPSRLPPLHYFCPSSLLAAAVSLKPDNKSPSHDDDLAASCHDDDGDGDGDDDDDGDVDHMSYHILSYLIISYHI